MKRWITALCLILLLVALAGCDNVDEKTDTVSDKYNIGDEVGLAGMKFNIYKIDDDKGELSLMAQKSIQTVAFLDAEKEITNDYEGSLIEKKVNRFVDDLEDAGIVVNSSGIIDKDDLIGLGFDVAGLNGTKYEISEEVPEFLKKEDNFWVDGYSKYDTYAWAYDDGILTTEKCESKYGIKPIIVIDASEAEKNVEKKDANITIKEIIDSDCAWSSEGGIANPYDRFYFDSKSMKFINVFKSSEKDERHEYAMKVLNDKTIRVEGLRLGYEVPAELTIVNGNKLRIHFVDDSYNDSTDNYLIAKD